jgi:hypothetical protein
VEGGFGMTIHLITLILFIATLPCHSITLIFLKNYFDVSDKLKRKLLQPGQHEDDDEKDSEDYEGFHALGFGKNMKIGSF